MLLSTVLAAVGVIGIPLTIPAWVNVLLAAVSVALLAVDAHRYREDRRRTTFVKRPPEDFPDVRRALADEDRWDVVTVHGQTFVHDRTVSGLIRDSGLVATLLEDRYRLPPELKALAGRYRRERIAKDSSIFNGPSLGWASGVGQAAPDQPIRLVRGNFFDRLATDYFAAVDTRRDGTETLIDGRRLFIDRRGALRDFDESWLFNGVGVSTIAVTSDGMLVITEQSVRNVGEQGLSAPSGSGSLEPKDFGGASSMSMAELSIAGAERELQEEASIEPADILASRFLGYGRWLDKAASPEVFAATLLRIDSHEVRRRKRREEERIYVDGVACVRPALPLADWRPATPDAIVPSEYRARMSLPLGAVLFLLAREAAAGSGEFTAELTRRLG